jgi:hypothetical protein
VAKRFLTPIGLPSGTANPDSGAAGDLFYRSDLGQIVVYDGTTWLPAAGDGVDQNGVVDLLVEFGILGSGSGTPETTVYVSQVDGGTPETEVFTLDYSGGEPDSALSDPTEFNITSEGSGGSSSTVSPTLPSSPSIGDTWFDSGAGRFYIYYDNFWVEV